MNRVLFYYTFFQIIQGTFSGSFKIVGNIKYIYFEFQSKFSEFQKAE